MSEQELSRQHDVYAAAREEYRKKIAEQAKEIERLRAENDHLASDRDGYVQLLTDENNRLRAANAELVEKLRDPSTVHYNMLRGTIAKPTLAQIIHLYGEDAIRAALPKQETE